MAETHPSGAKALMIPGFYSGTDKSVPFQSKWFAINFEDVSCDSFLRTLTCQRE